MTELTGASLLTRCFWFRPEYVEMSPVEIEAAYQAKHPGSSLFGELIELLQTRYEGIFAPEALKSRPVIVPAASNTPA